jgi:hypothetical protein
MPFHSFQVKQKFNFFKKVFVLSKVQRIILSGRGFSATKVTKYFCATKVAKHFCTTESGETFLTREN